jgi:hypothetical protein
VARLVLEPSTLQNEYAKLWNVFLQSAKGVGTLQAYFNTGFHASSKAGNPPICEMTGTFHFVGWPYRDRLAGSSKSKLVNIMATGADRYNCATGVLVHSTAQVSYVRCSNGKPKGTAVLQLHYDFHCGQGPAHPLFHAQLGAVKFDAGQLKVLRVDPGSVESVIDMLGGVRIPTPLIGLSGLLLGLAADHWDEKRFAGFLSTLKKLKVLEFPAACKELQDSVRGSSGSMHSHHWYGYAS